MTTWPVPRALVLLLLVQTLKLVESTESQTNPVSQSTPDPGGGQSPSSPAPGTPFSSDSKNDDKSESSKDDKSKDHLKGVMVAMDDEKTTPEFEFSKDDKTMTYTAKEGYGFNEVKWLRSDVHIMRADRNVWTAPNSSHFAQKVVVKDRGWLKYDLYVYQFHGGLHVYHRPAWGSRWSYTCGFIRPPKLEPEKSENIASKEHPKEISVVLKGQIEAKDSEDPKNSDPNYSVHKYIIKSRILFYQYEFRDNHECTELKFDGKSVWKFDPAKANQAHPKSVFVFLNTKTLILSFKDDAILVSRLEGDEWKSAFEGKPETCAVDIKNKASCVGFDFQKNDNTKVATYTAKDKHLINIVKTKELVLWNTDKLNQYATKVEVQGIGSPQKTLTLYLINGGTKNLKKSKGDGHWTEINPSSQINSTFSIDSILFKINMILKDSQDSDDDDSKKFQVVKYPYNNIVSFIFNDKISYLSIKAGTKEVTFKCSDTDFPISFKIQGKYISFDFTDKTHIYQYKNNYLDKVKEEKRREYTEMNIKLMYSEKEDGSDPKEMDNSKYKIYKFPFSYVYKFNKGVKCVEVKCKDQKLWKYGEDGSKKQFPKSITYDAYSANAHINFDDYYLSFNTSSSIFSRGDYNFLNESDCKITFFGSEGSDSSKELGEDKFEKSVDEYVTEYKFKDGVKCKEVKFNNDSVWTYDQTKHNDKYPKFVFLNRYLSLITVFFNHLWYYSFYYNGNRWSLASSFQDEAKEMVVLEPELFTGELVEESDKKQSGGSTPSGGGNGSSGNPAGSDGSGSTPTGGSTPSGGGGT